MKKKKSDRPKRDPLLVIYIPKRNNSVQSAVLPIVATLSARIRVNLHGDFCSIRLGNSYQSHIAQVDIVYICTEKSEERESERGRGKRQI